MSTSTLQKQYSVHRTNCGLKYVLAFIIMEIFYDYKLAYFPQWPVFNSDFSLSFSLSDL